jgi:hypothetical protein
MIPMMRHLKRDCISPIYSSHPAFYSIRSFFRPFFKSFLSTIAKSPKEILPHFLFKISRTSSVQMERIRFFAFERTINNIVWRILYNCNIFVQTARSDPALLQEAVARGAKRERGGGGGETGDGTPGAHPPPRPHIWTGQVPPAPQDTRATSQDCQE